MGIRVKDKGCSKVERR